MSEYGLRTYDAYGNVLVDVNARLNRFRYSVEVAKDDSGSVVLSDIAGQLTVEISLCVNVLNYSTPWFMTSHEVSRNGTTINWNAASNSIVRCVGIVIVFFYV